MRKSLEERFWEKVDIRGPDECWEWKAGKSDDGYGKFSCKHHYNVNAHAMAFMLTSQTSIGPGNLVRHTCDNRGCCNPRHLLIGTCADNSKDMVDRGRSCRGERNPASKFTSHDIIEIREMASVGYRQIDIARKFRTERQYIYRIVKGEAWKHIK